jgi:hypothetical protein
LKKRESKWSNGRSNRDVEMDMDMGDATLVEMEMETGMEMMRARARARRKSESESDSEIVGKMTQTGTVPVTMTVTETKIQIPIEKQWKWKPDELRMQGTMKRRIESRTRNKEGDGRRMKDEKKTMKPDKVRRSLIILRVLVTTYKSRERIHIQIYLRQRE